MLLLSAFLASESKSKPYNLFCFTYIEAAISSHILKLFNKGAHVNCVLIFQFK